MRKITTSIFLIIGLGMLVLSAVAWIQVPDGTLLATHWGVSGHADGFSSKPLALFLLPALMVALYVFFNIVPLPEQALAAKVYNIVNIGSLLIVGLAHVIIVLHALGVAFNVTMVMSVGMGVSFVAAYVICSSKRFSA